MGMCWCDHARLSAVLCMHKLASHKHGPCAHAGVCALAYYLREPMAHLCGCTDSQMPPALPACGHMSSPQGCAKSAGRSSTQPGEGEMMMGAQVLGVVALVRLGLMPLANLLLVGAFAALRWLPPDPLCHLAMLLQVRTRAAWCCFCWCGV